MNNQHKIGFGMAAIGRPLYINIKDKPTTDFDLETFRQKGIKMLDTAYNQGIRYFDTAPGYGMAEKIFMDWVQQKQDIHLELATKWGYTYTANFDPHAKKHEVKEHSLQKLNEQWANSNILLPHLKTYQIHSATFETGILENQAVLHRLAELKSEHNLLMGITTTGTNQIEVLKKALDVEVNGEALFDVSQVTYNIFDQSLALIADEISKQNKRLIIKEALANGRILPSEKYPHYSKAYASLEALAKKYDVGTDAIALRFCIDSIPTFKVLSGVATELHLSQNLKANRFQLNEEEVHTLKSFAINPKQYWHERKQLAWN